VLNSSGGENSVGGRVEIWSRALEMVADFPLTGVGMGAFTPVADTLYPFTSYSSGTITHAHNLFLQISLDLGLPGLVAWLAVLWGVLWRAWQVYRSGVDDREPWKLALGAALICTQVVLAVHGVVDAATWGTRPAIIVWAFWGTVMAVWNVNRENLEVKS
jgi:putative inorganic carbon (HCO3(-)) transporter